MAQLLSPRGVRLRGIRQPIWPVVDITHPINRGLVGYWQLDGQGFGLVPDYSGFGNNGTPNNISSIRDSHHGGNAFSFNGTSGNVVIPSNAAILGDNARTFAAWIYTTTISTATLRAIFSYGTASPPPNNFFVIYNNVTNAGDFYVSGGANDIRTSAGVISVNTWYHCAIVYRGGGIASANLFFYLNGTSQSTTTVGGAGAALNTASTAVHIGDDLTVAGRNYSGAIEGARWYNRALDAVEVQQLFAEPYAGIFDASASIVPGGVIAGLPLMGQIWLA